MIGESRSHGLCDCMMGMRESHRCIPAQTSSSLDRRLWEVSRGVKVIGSSDEVHVVDALAITGEEGRASLRKAWGSWQRSFDPAMSEWGNPALHRTLSARERQEVAVSGSLSSLSVKGKGVGRAESVV